MSKHTYHAIFTLLEGDIFTRFYDVDFIEIKDLKIRCELEERVMYETKIELMKYLYNLIKAEDLLPFPVVAKDITLKKNQFIKEIEVDTDVILEVFDNEHDFMFSEVSCFPACEGICRKVLNDIKKEYDGMSIDALKIYYEEDRVKGGYSVKNIIELGELLKSLEE